MFMAQAKLQTKLCLNNTDLPKKGVFLSLLNYLPLNE